MLLLMPTCSPRATSLVPNTGSVFMFPTEKVFPWASVSIYKMDMRSVGNKFGKEREESTHCWTFLIQLPSALYFLRLCSSLKPLSPPFIQVIFLSLLLNGVVLEKSILYIPYINIYFMIIYIYMYIYSDQKPYIQISVAQILAVWLKCMCFLSKASMINHLSSAYEDYVWWCMWESSVKSRALYSCKDLLKW